MAEQIVTIGNRVVAHGEDCFLSAGDTVICQNTGRTFENATVTACSCEIPADIDEVGYEYHAGVFVPCAPYGKGDGNLAVVCGEDCKALKDSGFPLSFLLGCGRRATGTYTGKGAATMTLPYTLDFIPSLMIISGQGVMCILHGTSGVSLHNSYYDNDGHDNQVDALDFTPGYTPSWRATTGNNTWAAACNSKNKTYSYIAFE